MKATLTPQVVKTYTLQLTMDEREARALLAIVGVVGRIAHWAAQRGRSDLRRAL